MWLIADDYKYIIIFCEMYIIDAESDIIKGNMRTIPLTCWNMFKVLLDYTGLRYKQDYKSDGIKHY